MGKESKKMQKMVYLGNFQIPNQQNKMDLFECSCGYKTAVESGRFLNYEIYCNHCEETQQYHLKEDERNRQIEKVIESNSQQNMQ